jgi:hypothetical protein
VLSSDTAISLPVDKYMQYLDLYEKLHVKTPEGHEKMQQVKRRILAAMTEAAAEEDIELKKSMYQSFEICFGNPVRTIEDSMQLLREKLMGKLGIDFEVSAGLTNQELITIAKKQLS